ncbi:hypothetical protein V5H34_17830, partial [Vibrio cholerae]|uniref:hypothetical protein n=1 Tax=Vibrio cholerae TaxID=666 RepID=UPI0039672BCA
IEPRWLQLLCLSLVVMRCQPLRRALCALKFRSKNALVFEVFHRLNYGVFVASFWKVETDLIAKIQH